MLLVLCVVAIFLGALSAGAHGDVDARANEGRTMTFVITTEGYGQREAALRYKYRTGTAPPKAVRITVSAPAW